MTSAEIVEWSARQDAMGQQDATGGRWSDWLVAVRNADGSSARDRSGHQVFETQAAFSARQADAPMPLIRTGETMELFA